jgi:hypothetical protein
MFDKRGSIKSVLATMASASLASHHTSSSSVSFSQAFAGAAHHFFPDGCPEDWLESVWPPRADRSPVPSTEAAASIRQLQQHGTMGLLSLTEMNAVAIVACETLPKRSGVRSPLVDGTAKLFGILLRALVPNPDENDYGLVDRLVSCLVSAASAATADARCVVLLFFTLAARHFGPFWRQALGGSYYIVVIHWALQPATAADSVRLLLAVTQRRHASRYRAEQLRARYDELVLSVDQKTQQQQQQPLIALLDLYARLNPDECGACAIKTNSNIVAAWFLFPDPEWARGCTGQSPNPGNKIQPPAFSAFLDRLPQLLLAPDSALLHEDGDASSLGSINNLAVRHGTMLSPQGNLAVARLRNNLPYLLYEQWYKPPLSSTTSNSRDDDDDAYQQRQLHLLRELATFATHTQALPPEAEQFVVRHVLPVWDGSYEMTQVVCHDLIPSLSPRSYNALRGQVLQHLEPLFVHGTAHLQYAIISGALAGLVYRWGCRSWAEDDTSLFGDATTAGDHDTAKVKVLRELIQWTDDLLLKGFLCSGHDLLFVAAIDFFSAVCDLADHIATFLAAPSAAVMYRLLLSTSALSVDRACDLLVKYKTSFQKLKARQHDGLPTSSAYLTTGMDRVKLFNCFLWDFCSVLWRCSAPSDDAARNMSILYTDLRPETQSRLCRSASAPLALSISHGAAFTAFAADFLRRRSMDHPPPLDFAMLLRGKTKVQYLDYLREFGFHGVYDFLYTFVASLAKRQQQQKLRGAASLNAEETHVATTTIDASIIR